MYEMLDCLTQLGIIAREENVVMMPGKFPEKGSELAEVYSEWSKMHRARMGTDRVSNPEFSVNKQTALYKYYMSLNMDCCTGDFVYPKGNPEEEKEFLECVKKLGSVSLYINQQRQANPEFKYTNEVEYEELKVMCHKYKRFLPQEYIAVMDEIGDAREKTHKKSGPDDVGVI